jgi:hypothetical protein
MHDDQNQYGGDSLHYYSFFQTALESQHHPGLPMADLCCMAHELMPLIHAAIAYYLKHNRPPTLAPHNQEDED